MITDFVADYASALRSQKEPLPLSWCFVAESVKPESLSEVRKTTKDRILFSQCLILIQWRISLNGSKATVVASTSLRLKKVCSVGSSVSPPKPVRWNAQYISQPDGDNIGGVYTKEDVSSGETLATLPFRLAITSLQARNEFPTLGQFSSRVVLSLYLVQQKLLGAKSFYWPYIRMLPETIMTPMTFGEEDMRLLDNTNLAASVRERKKNLFNSFQSLIKVLPENVEKELVTW